MKVRLALYAASLVTGIACDPAVEEVAHGASNVADNDTLACEDLVVENIDRACETVNSVTHPIMSSPLSFGGGPPVRSDVRGYGVHLVESSPENGGQVSFTPPASGDYLAYLGTPNIRFQFQQDSSVIEPTCTVRFHEDPCFLLRRGNLYELREDTTYDIRFGPITPQRWVRLVLLDPNLVVECAPEELGTADMACFAANTEEPRKRRAARFQNSLSGTIELGTIYGITLLLGAEDNSGSLPFNPPSDGKYSFYLGTPNIPFAIHNQEKGLTVDPSCQSPIMVESCDPFRRAYQFDLIGGTQYRIDFGPIEGKRWVRFLAVQE